MIKAFLYSILSACFTSRLTFTVLLIGLSTHIMAKNNPPQDSLSRTFTVAKVFMEKYSEPGTVEVTFYESARFYKIPKSNPHHAAYISLLKEALKKKEPVVIRLTERNGDIIDSVSKVKKPGGG